MAGLREIKTRLNSVRNTKKITYAMKLVSAAKLRKAQEAVLRAREYADALNRVLSDLIKEIGEVTHPLMEKRTVKTVRVIIAGGSRGLCGAYNTNLNKRVDQLYKELAAEYPGAKVEAVILGKKPAENFRRTKKEYVKSYEELPEDPNLWPTDQVVADTEKAFIDGHVDAVYLVSTKFKSALSMTAYAEKLFPIDESSLSSTSATQEQAGTTLFEPSAAAVWEQALPRLVRSKVRQATLDAKASEHGSRMTAMDNATKNSGDIIYALQLTYNKLRQGRITAELLDIIGGAEALT